MAAEVNIERAIVKVSEMGQGYSSPSQGPCVGVLLLLQPYYFGVLKGDPRSQNYPQPMRAPCLGKPFADPAATLSGEPVSLVRGF